MLVEISIETTKSTGGIATVWPASGLYFAILLLSPPKQHIRYVVAIAVASLTGNLSAGTSPLFSCIFTLANATEGLVAYYLMKFIGVKRLSFIEPVTVAKFCIAAISGTLWSASVVTLLTQGTWSFFFLWQVTDMLGILLITPLIFIITNIVTERSFTRKEWRRPFEIMALLLMVIGVTAGSFSQTSYPLFFLPPVAVLVVTYRLGPFGAAISVLIVAIISTIFAGMGLGPIRFVAGGKEVAGFFQQFYLLVLLGTAMMFAALQSASRKLTRSLDESNSLLMQAESIANLGHWRLDLHHGTLFWSEEVFCIHGLKDCDGTQDRHDDEEMQAPKLAHNLSLYHKDDRAYVRGILKRAIATASPFEYQARIVRPDDTIRHITSRGQVQKDENDEAVALFGMIQDVTQQVETTYMLKQAQKLAEQAAARAQKLANTDQLTGIPNRRHTLNMLKEYIAKAHRKGGELSVAMFDIDHFKAVNDQHGHAVGDQILRFVAQHSGKVLRADDLVGRIGGEEFVIVLPGANTHRTMEIAERLRISIEKGSNARFGGNGVTISIGVASLKHAENENAMDSDQLLLNADEALYKAKRLGRNILQVAA